MNMNYSEKIIGDIECHSTEGIKECFENGVSPNDLFNGLPLLYELTSEYNRSPKFRECVKLFVDYGLEFEDTVLLAVLMNDAGTLEDHIKKQPDLVKKRYSLRCAYTPLDEVTLLHICAEFNHCAAAAVLIKYGADVNAAAGTDEYGFGAQTPVFHTVNQNKNQSWEMLNFLLERNAGLDRTVRGFIWGKGYHWETLIPAVNPVSYAMMGLLPQMHRSEETIAGIIKLLLNHQYGIDYSALNVPNKYLKS
jgi:hypothetical protein